jgi:2-oxoglutarate ferredoxin oxidoreductase subunit alpha
MRVRQDIPPTQVYGDEDADLLVLGWGSTKGAIEEAVERAVEKDLPVARAQLRHMWPLPGDLGDLLDRYDEVLVPELNNGQLCRILRDEYLKDVRPLNKIQGRPFRAQEILDEVKTMLSATPA